MTGIHHPLLNSRPRRGGLTDWQVHLIDRYTGLPTIPSGLSPRCGGRLGVLPGSPTSPKSFTTEAEYPPTPSPGRAAVTEAA